jgi:uncharacterized protein YjiS (DUF1127 family)
MNGYALHYPIKPESIPLEETMSLSIMTTQIKHKPVFCKLNSLFQLLQLMMDKHYQRKQLAQLTIDQLTDMGIDPADAQIEISKPFWK